MEDLLVRKIKMY